MTKRERQTSELYRKLGFQLTAWNILANRMPVWGAHFFESFNKAKCLWRAIERIHGKGSGILRRPLKVGFASTPYWRVARRPL